LEALTNALAYYNVAKSFIKQAPAFVNFEQKNLSFVFFCLGQSEAGLLNIQVKIIKLGRLKRNERTVFSKTR